MKNSLIDRGIACFALAILALIAIPAQAEVDLGSLDLLASNTDNSPVPRGAIVGGIVISGQARYQALDNEVYAIPGLVYFGEKLVYLGDRARYYFYKEGQFSAFAYGRVRFGNLDPADAVELAGMQQRDGQLEMGIGANYVTPYALLTVRAASDVTGTSKGQEALLWADFPIVKDNLLIMPGTGVMIRSAKMANYYFGGVSGGEATATRPAWDTGTTISPMAALITSYRFNKDWIGLFALNYEWYDSSIKNSPLVQHSGELYAGAGVGYVW
ncbi:MipA/OmpV family protein [Chitinibacter sp. S2-10]|uniref:MipA/OmpV family protein n=1 Tax=Chitinibacter sp. S2-10 TaxID=3373597 RepID=UPI0039779971